MDSRELVVQPPPACHFPVLNFPVSLLPRYRPWRSAASKFERAVAADVRRRTRAPISSSKNPPPHVGRYRGALCFSGWLGVWSLMLGVCVLPAAPCTPAPSGIVGWWPAEGNAIDLAGTNTGSLIGGATATASGMVGTAFAFD